MRISDWSSDVCSSDLDAFCRRCESRPVRDDHARGRQFPRLRHHSRRGWCRDDVTGVLRPGGPLQYSSAVRLHAQVGSTAAGLGPVELIASEARTFLLLTAATQTALNTISENTDLEVVAQHVIDNSGNIFHEDCKFLTQIGRAHV